MIIMTLVLKVMTLVNAYTTASSLGSDLEAGEMFPIRYNVTFNNCKKITYAVRTVHNVYEKVYIKRYLFLVT